MLQKIIRFGVCCILSVFIGVALGIFSTTEPGTQPLTPEPGTQPLTPEPGTQPLTPEQQRESWLRVHQALRYEVLSVAASKV